MSFNRWIGNGYEFGGGTLVEILAAGQRNMWIKVHALTPSAATIVPGAGATYDSAAGELKITAGYPGQHVVSHSRIQFPGGGNHDITIPEIIVNSSDGYDRPYVLPEFQGTDADGRHVFHIDTWRTLTVAWNN